MGNDSSNEKQGGIGCWGMVGIAAVVILIFVLIYFMVI